MSTTKGTIFSPRLYPRLETNYVMRRSRVAASDVYIFQTADTRACIVGCVKLRGGELYFAPGRLHLSGLRNLDLDITTHLMMMTKEYQDSISHIDPKHNTVGAMLLREPIAQNPFLNSSLANITPQLYLVMDVHHVADEKGLRGKIGKISHYRLDLPEEPEIAARVQEEITHAIMVDSIAGGRNLIVAIRELKKRFPNLSEITIVSVFATIQGVERISKICSDELGVKSTFFVYHELLDVNPVNMYDCYFPKEETDPRDAALLKKYFGDKMYSICMGGDFTANIYGKAQARSVWRSQIAEIGFSQEDLPVEPISLHTLKELGYTFDDIVPYSTIWAAMEKNIPLETLQKMFEEA